MIIDVLVHLLCSISRFIKLKLCSVTVIIENRTCEIPRFSRPHKPEVPRMKVIAFNGSPRKKWNTATLLDRALEGAASVGAETKLVHLYDIGFKGCRACYSCKLLGGSSYGKCAAKDGLTPFLKDIETVNAFFLGSPIYFWSMTGVARMFMERLLYPYTNAVDSSVLPDKKIPTGLIFTMGAPEEQMKERGWDQQLLGIGALMQMIFGTSETMFVNNTTPFEDYSKYATNPMVDPEEKARIRREEFPVFCDKAFEMGARFAKGSGSAG